MSRGSLAGKVRALLGVSLAQMMEYRAEVYLWALAGTLPLILLGVWAQAATDGAFPLSRVEFIRYFIVAFLVRQFTFVWVIWEFEELVTSGRLSQQLLQPLDPIWRFLASHLTERVVRLPVVFGIVGLCFLAYPEARWVPRVADVASAFGLLFVAFCARFMLQYMMSMLSFWSERAGAIEELWFVVHLFLSGLMAPLDVMPSGVRAVAELTPFPYLVYYPANLLLGRGAPLGKAACVLLVWGVGAWLVQRVLWKRGLQSYTAMGA
jgi:ABC-2 type transport system permease protein